MVPSQGWLGTILPKIYFSFMGNILTTSEAAEKMNVSASRIRQLILEKRIDSKKIGRDHLIDENEIIQFKCSGQKKRGRPNKSLRKR